MELAFRIVVNEKKAVTYLPAGLVYSKSVHKVFIALFFEYLLCFLLCHNLHLHILKTCGIGKTVVSVSCARFKTHICKSRPPPPPTMRPRSSCICPCLRRRRRSTHFFSSASGVNACAQRIDKIHIFKSPCNVLFIIQS